MKVHSTLRSLSTFLFGLRDVHRHRHANRIHALRWPIVNAAALSILVGGLALSQSANATVWVYVSDVSQLQYSTNGNFIYFRNFNQFNTSALGCCWNYWIDTTTTEGKNTFALMMAAAAQAKPMYFGVPDGYASGMVILNGIW
jgi:hypothetical protein